MNEKLFDFIEKSPTPFHAVAGVSTVLEAAGYTELCEGESWKLEGGKGYFVTRNGSSVIAFRLPEGDFSGFMIAASHDDSPAFKIKENAELKDRFWVRFSTEKYGGMICSTWLDRPLSVAGRLMVRTENGCAVRLVDLKAPTALIPNVAIHMNRNVNDGVALNPAVDMLPLYGLDPEGVSLKKRLADAVGVGEKDILSTDLIVYNPQKGVEWNDFVSAPRLDDLECAFGSFEAFLAAKASKNIPVYALFDNEEVGSQTKQGAASTFLCDTVDRICESLGLSASERCQKVAGSFMASCDNAHAVHPNHPEFSDKNHAVYMNRGIVIKYNTNQRYTSDAVSTALFRLICEKAGAACQLYANRADMAGGSTLGNIANTQVSLNTIDIGLAQLAMHSSFETAGAKDVETLVKALTAFYETALKMESDGSYALS